MTRGRKAYGTYPLGALDAADLRAKSLSSVPDRSPRDHKLAGLPEVTPVGVTEGARPFYLVQQNAALAARLVRLEEAARAATLASR